MSSPGLVGGRRATGGHARAMPGITLSVNRLVLEALGRTSGAVCGRSPPKLSNGVDPSAVPRTRLEVTVPR